MRQVKDVYDLSDAFIDDSEIAIDDAETHVPRPVKEGFFVHSGQVELMSA
jgi:cell wall assembly regulator SMI1